MMRTKDEAMERLKNLLHASQKIVQAYKDNKNNLDEVKILARDYDIGLELFEEQLIMLKNKTAYEMIDKFLENIISVNCLDGEMANIENEDSWIQNLVECIFLEKKIKEEDAYVEVKLLKENEKKDAIKADVNLLGRDKTNKAVAKESGDKKKMPSAVHDQIPDAGVYKESINLPKVRIPFGWKNGQEFSGGSREQHRNNEKSKKLPSKEYRGTYEKDKYKGIKPPK